MNTDCLFIHVPKTGGRSVLDACGLKFTVQHKTIQDYINELGESAVAGMFKFSTVRNPWDRAYSWWRFFVAGKAVYPEFRDNFEAWVLKRMLAVNQRKNLGNTKRPLEQMSYYKDASGVVRIDKFLRFESLGADFMLIASRVGAIKPLGHIGGEPLSGSAFNRDYHSAYKSQQAVDLVGQLNKETIDRFGYTY